MEPTVAVSNPEVFAFIHAVISAIGPTGMIFMLFLFLLFGLGPTAILIGLWYVDKQKIDEILREYSKDMQEMRNMYTTNVSLVKRYEDLADELSNLIRLNTQAQTNLVKSIDNNLFCPVVRENGPKGESNG
ncbi:MAG: hypothetical protein MI862_26130 [Desulfobacterales bacterium]|nr:hypothetical protein [Desulfobacterales bacterium]